MANKQHLILIGLMGVGKSTIGRQLAAHQGISFIDTDHEIEREQDQRITDIFQQQGEGFFRALEKKVLARVTTLCTQHIIATGGGIVIEADNRERMKQYGMVVWLNVPPEAIYRRLCGNRSRPLLQQGNPLKKLQELYAQRAAWYRSCCDLEIKSADLTPRQVVEQVNTFMAAFGHEKANLSR